MGNSDPRLLFFSALSAPKLGHVSMGRRDIFLSFRVILPLKQPNLSPFPKAVKDYVRCTVRNLYNSTQVGNDTKTTSDFFPKTNPNPPRSSLSKIHPGKKPTSQIQTFAGFPMGFSSFPKKSPWVFFVQRNRALWGHRGSFHQWRLRIDSFWSRASYGTQVLRVDVSFQVIHGLLVYIYQYIYIEFMLKIR